MEIDLNPTQRLAYDAVIEILDAKRGYVEPCVAHIDEIRNSIDVELLEALASYAGVESSLSGLI